MKALGMPPSARVEALLAAGESSWYAPGGSACYQPATARLEPVPTIPGHARVADFRRMNGVVRTNPGASLVDLGDGIGCIELHSLKNAIGGDVLQMISAVLNPASDAVRDFAGFVISGDRDNFSVGANLMQLLMLAQEGEWDEVAGGHPQLSADDRGHQVLPAARWWWRPLASRWAEARRSACTRRAASRTRKPTSAWSKRALG